MALTSALACGPHSTRLPWLAGLCQLNCLLRQPTLTCHPLTAAPAAASARGRKGQAAAKGAGQAKQAGQEQQPAAATAAAAAGAGRAASCACMQLEAKRAA